MSPTGGAESKCQHGVTSLGTVLKYRVVLRSEANKQTDILCDAETCQQITCALFVITLLS